MRKRKTLKSQIGLVLNRKEPLETNFDRDFSISFHKDQNEFCINESNYDKYYEDYYNSQTSYLFHFCLFMC